MQCGWILLAKVGLVSLQHAEVHVAAMLLPDLHSNRHLCRTHSKVEMEVIANALQICKNCGTRNTPFWRKDKNDGRPLCNACGLYFAKNDMQRPKVLWKEGEGGMAGGVVTSGAAAGQSIGLKSGTVGGSGGLAAGHTGATVVAGAMTGLSGLPNVSGTVMVMPAGLGGMLPMGLIDPKLLGGGLAGLPLTGLLPASALAQLQRMQQMQQMQSAAGAAMSGAASAPVMQLATMTLQPSTAAALAASQPAGTVTAAALAAAAAAANSRAAAAAAIAAGKLPATSGAPTLMPQLLRFAQTANGVSLPIPDFAALAAAQNANKTIIASKAAAIAQLTAANAAAAAAAANAANAGNAAAASAAATPATAAATSAPAAAAAAPAAAASVKLEPTDVPTSAATAAAVPAAAESKPAVAS